MDVLNNQRTCVLSRVRACRIACTRAALSAPLRPAAPLGPWLASHACTRRDCRVGASMGEQGSEEAVF